MSSHPTSQPVRLYTRGVFLGYQRNKVHQHMQNALIKIEGCHQSTDAQYYLGKRVAFIYKAKTTVNGSHYRAIWGKVSRPHGTNGVVRAKFQSNLPSHAMGKYVRVMLYPSHV